MSAGDAIAAVCRSELLRTARDRTALFFALLLPVILIGMSAIFAGGDTSVDLGVFDPAGEVSAELERSSAVTVIRYDRSDELERDVQTGRADAGLLVAEIEGVGYSGRLLIDPTRQATDPARFAARDAIRDVAAFDTTVQALRDLQDLDPDAAEAAAAGVIDITPVTVESTLVGSGQSESEDSRTYAVLGNLILFMFINSMAIGGQLVGARQLGVIRRSLAAPVSPVGLASGFIVARFVFALLQAGIILVVGAVLFDVEFGNPVAVGSIVVMFACISAAAGLILGTLAKTPDQAPAIGVPISIGFAMLGGCMWPLFIVPDVVRQVGHLTPHAWAVDGLVDVAFDGGSITSIGVELAVLTGFSVALGAIAARSLRGLTAS